MMNDDELRKEILRRRDEWINAEAPVADKKNATQAPVAVAKAATEAPTIPAPLAELDALRKQVETLQAENARLQRVTTAVRTELVHHIYFGTPVDGSDLRKWFDALFSLKSAPEQAPAPSPAPAPTFSGDSEFTPLWSSEDGWFVTLEKDGYLLQNPIADPESYHKTLEEAIAAYPAPEPSPMTEEEIEKWREFQRKQKAEFDDLPF